MIRIRAGVPAASGFRQCFQVPGTCRFPETIVSLTQRTVTIMEAQYDDFEVVSVIHHFKLVDSESYERLYRRRDGVPLLPGYYVVNWPTTVIRRRFNEEAIFFGPYESRKGAQIVATRWCAKAPRLGGAVPPHADRAADVSGR